MKSPLVHYSILFLLIIMVVLPYNAAYAEKAENESLTIDELLGDFQDSEPLYTGSQTRYIQRNADEELPGMQSNQASETRILLLRQTLKSLTASISNNEKQWFFAYQNDLYSQHQKKLEADLKANLKKLTLIEKEVDLLKSYLRENKEQFPDQINGLRILLSGSKTLRRNQNQFLSLMHSGNLIPAGSTGILISYMQLFEPLHDFFHAATLILKAKTLHKRLGLTRQILMAIDAEMEHQ